MAAPRCARRVGGPHRRRSRAWLPGTRLQSCCDDGATSQADPVGGESRPPRGLQPDKRRHIMNTTHNAVFAVGVAHRLTATRCTKNQLTDRGQPNTTIRNQLARFLRRRTAQPVPSRRLPLPPMPWQAASAWCPGPSLDPTWFPPEPLQDQINDQSCTGPDDDRAPAGDEMTPEQLWSVRGVSKHEEFFRCPECDEEPPPDLGQMPEIRRAP
jgi:hypothetical protein